MRRPLEQALKTEKVSCLLFFCSSRRTQDIPQGLNDRVEKGSQP